MRKKESHVALGDVLYIVPSTIIRDSLVVKKKTHVSADAFAIQMQRESEYVKDSRSGGYYVSPSPSDENYR